MKKYECPKCGEWIECYPENGNDSVTCPDCKSNLELDVDAEFIPGTGWRDRTKLVLRALAGLVAAAILSVQGQTVEVYNSFGKRDDADWKNAAKQIFVCGGGYGRWITIGRIDTTSPDQNGFSPNWTYIIVKFKPVVKQLPNGNY